MQFKQCLDQMGAMFRKAVHTNETELIQKFDEANIEAVRLLSMLVKEEEKER